ncbi:hypothetical protein PA25_06230 [Pseudoalteromonas sp. A25]|uniref:hypothetical protein n=1 Tax=Pseudoalteromonas sp. A25 TaxID=116092 RepID=UPI001261207A|nr:hypothetical protein [Pseudoalteromonas sp. A25]BBN80638.1 hypothetical protein PA25_06230 [Pseudoalteromonas sp. A25]
MTLNDFLNHLAWIFKGYEALIVLWFLITQFPKYRWSLFYARHHTLNSLPLHELHSCFMTALCYLLFHLYSSEIDNFIIRQLSTVDGQIKLFYLTAMINQFLFLLTLFSLHRFKGCFFSKTARVNLYTTLALMALLFMQLVARGYFDYHELGMVYVFGGWACNIISVSALSIYPIRQTLGYFQKRSVA